MTIEILMFNFKTMRGFIVIIGTLFAVISGRAFSGYQLKFATVGDEDISGNNQVGETGSDLPRCLALQVFDQGKPVVHVPVHFSILSEPVENSYPGNFRARLSDTVVYTDQLGIARTRLRLGSNTGEYLIKGETADSELVFVIRALKRRWYLGTILEIIGGMAIFLFGLYYGSKGLRRLAGDRLRQVIFALIPNRLLGVLVGIIVTAIFQSSSATIGLLISLASSGLITVGQSLGVILGADIGTTITIQLLAFRIYEYALFAVAAGLLLMNSSWRLKDIGQVIFGFGLVFFSLKMVLSAVEPLKYLSQFQAFFRAGTVHPLLSFMLALVFTALVRSSAATIGMTVALSFSGIIGLESAIPLILGANVGSGVTALVTAWNTKAAGRRVAVAQLLFKLITTLMIIPVIPPAMFFFSRTSPIAARQIANAHTLINIAAAVIFLPLIGVIEKLLQVIIPEPVDDETGPRYLDTAALDSPELALAQGTREILRMGEMVQNMLEKSLIFFLENDKEGCRWLASEDDRIDRLEEGLKVFLSKIPPESQNPETSKRTRTLFYITEELEHIADIVSKNMVVYIRKRINNNLAFSPAGLEEIKNFHQEVLKNLTMALGCIATWDGNMAQQLAEKRVMGIERKRELQNRHLERLALGLKETLDTSSIHLDLISDLERINFHCSQIGAAIASVALG